MSTRVSELFAVNTQLGDGVNWADISERQYCKYLSRKCLKIRKSQPESSIGTCSVCYGAERAPIIICPHRLLENNQIFTDCLHLLTLHEPGNQYHGVSEVTLPGGSVDYFLISAEGGKVKDFLGTELQTLDTSGTVWPERQRFLQSRGLVVPAEDVVSTRSFGMNWKMTAKTTLVQLHHKVETMERLGKHLVIVIQDPLLSYMKRRFSFGHIGVARIGDPMHFHSYSFGACGSSLALALSERLSTDSAGVAASLGLEVESDVPMDEMVSQLEAKISERTLLRLFPDRSDDVSSDDIPV